MTVLCPEPVSKSGGVDAQDRKALSEKFLMVGVTDPRPDAGEPIVRGIAEKLRLPEVVDIVKIVVNSTEFKLRRNSLTDVLHVYNEILDQIEVALVVHQGGAVFSTSPIAIAGFALYRAAGDGKVSSADAKSLERLMDKAFDLSTRFTHFVHIFSPSSEEGGHYIDTMSTLVAGVHTRYDERIGRPFIKLPEFLSRDSDKIDFAVRVINLL